MVEDINITNALKNGIMFRNNMTKDQRTLIEKYLQDNQKTISSNQVDTNTNSKTFRIESKIIGDLNEPLESANSLMPKPIVKSELRTRNSSVNLLTDDITKNWTLINNSQGSINEINSGNLNHSISIDENKNTYSSRKSNRNLKFFDKNNDRQVSDNEAIDYILQTRAQKIATSRTIFSFNENAIDFDKVAKAFDKATSDGVFTNQEVSQALLALSKTEFSDIKFENALTILKRNIHLDEIKTIVDFIDANSNGAISDIEVLDSVLAGRKGLINIQNENAEMILKTNANFDKILDLLKNTNGNFTGEISDKDVFNILMGFRSGNISQDQVLMSLFLEKNSNRFTISDSINILDTNNNGEISESEFGNFILNYRNGTINQEQNLIVKNIVENSNNFKNLLDVINVIDQDATGSISDEEVINFSLAVKKGFINLDEDLTNLILGKNENLKALIGLMDFVNKDNNEEIESNEVFNTIISMNSGKFDVQDYQLVNKIISRNPNKEEIENAINLIDKNKDGIIEDEDVIEAEISLRKGLLQNIDPNILKTVFDSNTNTDKIQKTLDLFDSEKNGEMKINNFIDIVLNHRQGLLSIPDFSIFTKVIKTLDKEFNALKSLEILDSRNDGVISDKSFAQGILADRAGLAILNTELINHISNKNKNFQMIQSAISIMDSDNNGSINAEEFTNNFKAAISINGVVDFNKMSVISNVLDIIYPDAIKLDKFRDDLDVNKDTQLSDMEIIEGLLKLRNNVIENPGLDIIKMVISGNENYLKIIDSIDKIDLDLDGIISDSDCINGLIATRQGKFTNEQLPLVQAVLVKNTKYNELQNVLNVFDKDLNGEISDLELIDTMFKFRRGEIDINIDPQIIENLKDQNKNREKIEILISIIDPDNSGNIDNHELIKGILAVNSGAIERPIDEILVTLPNEKSEKFGEEILKAEILIKQIDQNKNGQIADNEVASIILANKKNDLLSTYSSEFTEAVFATNPKSTEIISLIDTIDKDQDGFFSEQEIIDAVLENRQGLLKTSSNEILEAVLTNNPEYSKIKNLISRVDIDGDGRISEQNIVESLFLFKDSKLPEKYSTINENKLDERSLELLDLILSKNKSKISLENSFNQLSINSNGDLMVMKNTLLELKFGEINNPEIENLVIPAQRIINNWDLQVKSSYSQEINMLIDIVGDQAINKNLSSLGLNSLEGFLTELNSIKNNLVNGKKTSFNELHRLINNYQTTVSSIPYSSPDIISKIFYEDFKTNLNTIKSFLDTGVINDHDSKFQEIAGLAIRFDKDQDGKFNDQELMNGLLDVKLNKVTVSNPEFLDLIFNSNSNYETIKNFISNADKDTNGLISKNDLINFYNSITQSNSINNKNLLSLMAEHDDLKTIFKTIKTFDIFGNAQYSDSAILLGLLQTRKQNNEIYDQETINSILTLNQDSTGIQKLVDIIDPDKNGLYHNIYDVLNNAISIWQGKIPSNNLAYDFNGDGIVNNKDASTLYNLHMSINNLSAFKIFN